MSTDMRGQNGFAALGRDVEIFEPVSFAKKGNIFIQSRVSISEFGFFHGGSGFYIGNFVHIASHASLAGGGLCIIEDFACLAAGVRLINGTELVDGSGLVGPTVPSAYRAVRRSWVHVGRHVFLGTNVVVLPGVTIGEGAVVGANSLVTRDLKPWTVYHGSPAREVGPRDGSRIKTLEKLAYAEAGLESFDVASLLEKKQELKSAPEGKQ